MLVLNGIGGDADVREGAELYRRSCEGGVAVACQNLGSLYVNGRPGFQTNWAEGRRYFERACLLGLEESCAYLRGD
jgi:hypothetical protein